MPRTEEVRARDVQVGDTVLNINGWWPVVAREESARYVELSLGKPAHPYDERWLPDEFVTRMRREPRARKAPLGYELRA